MSIRNLLYGAAVLFLVGCGAKRIPGTDIEDTDDTRAILAVMERFRSAVEARDVDGVVQLVSESFKDDGGTATPEDDLDYAGLKKHLPERFAKFDDIHLDMSVRKITVYPDTGTASVIYYYSMSFKIPHLSNKPRNESDIKEMWFKRDHGQWKITSGV